MELFSVIVQVFIFLAVDLVGDIRQTVLGALKLVVTCFLCGVQVCVYKVLLRFIT